MKDTQGFPFYVRAGLIGIRSRNQAWLQFWLAIVISLFLFSFFNIGASLFWTLVYCGSLLLAAYWYASCIRWVDEHSGW